jgi:hypothetical protein
VLREGTEPKKGEDSNDKNALHRRLLVIIS